MTDRELLELAAKTAGITFIKWVDDVQAWLCETNNSTPRYYWNPLNYDGDALRLAVKLQLTLDLHTMCCRVQRRHDEPRTASHEEWFAGDPYSATRRAIVRAAAEIGRNL